MTVIVIVIEKRGQKIATKGTSAFAEGLRRDRKTTKRKGLSPSTPRNNGGGTFQSPF